MKFDTWKLINEDYSPRDLNAVAYKVANTIEKEFDQKFTIIPEFEQFTRPNEPVQIGYLLTNDTLRSIRLNFTEDKVFYSVDFWKPDEKENSSVTVYLDPDAPLETSVSKLLKYWKNPDTNNLKEDTGDVKATKSKSEKEANTTIKKTQKRIDYEIGDPRELFDDLETYVDMVIEGKMNALIVTGQPGVGKTYLVTKRLNEKGLTRNQDYFKITGKTTSAGLYISLYKHNGKILIYDDIDSVFYDDNSINILKGAIDTSQIREVSWNSAFSLKSSDKEPIPTKFDFTGRVIFISNLSKKKLNSAIKSRAFFLEIALSKEDMLYRMWKILPALEVPTGARVPEHIKDKAMEMLVVAAEQSQEVELNLRTLLKSIAIVDQIPNENTALRLIKQQCAY